jgi:hypothetical protein
VRLGVEVKPPKSLLSSFSPFLVYLPPSPPPTRRPLRLSTFTNKTLHPPQTLSLTLSLSRSLSLSRARSLSFTLSLSLPSRAPIRLHSRFLLSRLLCLCRITDSTLPALSISHPHILQRPSPQSSTPSYTLVLKTLT